MLVISLYQMLVDLTIPVARYQNMMVNGSATIYLILLVKLNNSAKLPAKPQLKDMAFQTISQWGSFIPIPFSSFPRGNCPLSGSVTLQVVTNAAIDKTLARGPMVAAKRGMAVDANHQSLELYGIRNGIVGSIIFNSLTINDSSSNHPNKKANI